MKKQPVTAAGGVLYRKETDGRIFVLLIYRRGVWDLPKGKKEEGETVEECAAREVAEEVGCPFPSIMGPLGKTCHEYKENNLLMCKTTHWFAMQTSHTEGLEPEQEEGIEKVKWVPLGEARQLVGYENLLKVLNTFREWVKK